MTTLVLCLNEYTDAGLNGNPSLAVRALGIAWDEFVPCPMADRIILKGCANVPESLPVWLTVAPDMQPASPRRQPRLSGHDVYDAMLKCPGVIGMGIGDCHAVAQILNQKLGLL